MRRRLGETKWSGKTNFQGAVQNPVLRADICYSWTIQYIYYIVDRFHIIDVYMRVAQRSWDTGFGTGNISCIEKNNPCHTSALVGDCIVWVTLLTRKSIKSSTVADLVTVQLFLDRDYLLWVVSSLLLSHDILDVSHQIWIRHCTRLRLPINWAMRHYDSCLRCGRIILNAQRKEGYRHYSPHFSRRTWTTFKHTWPERRISASVRDSSLKWSGKRALATWMRDEPTIFALSSAPGRAAIAIVRVSGSACLAVWMISRVRYAR